MSWDYRIVDEGIAPEKALILCEVYYRDEKPWMYCHALLAGETLQEMESDLQRMHRAFTMGVILSDDFPGPRGNARPPGEEA